MASACLSHCSMPIFVFYLCLARLVLGCRRHSEHIGCLSNSLVSRRIAGALDNQLRADTGRSGASVIMGAHPCAISGSVMHHDLAV